MQNDLFEKWYSLSFPNSSLERNEDGSYFRRKTNFSLESFKAGQQSKQAEIDELRKNFNNALKTIEIQQRFLDDADGANKILTSQASDLQKRIDDALEKCRTGIRKQGGEYYLELIEGILKGDTK